MSSKQKLIASAAFIVLHGLLNKNLPATPKKKKKAKQTYKIDRRKIRLRKILAKKNTSLETTRRKLIQEKERRRRHRWWIKLRQAKSQGLSGVIDTRRPVQQEISVESTRPCPSFGRMSVYDFEALMNTLGGKIRKEDTNYRKAIPADQRLGLTLRFLESGDSFSSLSKQFGVSKQAMSSIIPEVCQAIVDSLRDKIKLPVCRAEWKASSAEFESRWNFPHCLGVVDGRSLVVQYMGKDSNMFLFVIVDAHYNIIYSKVMNDNSLLDGIFHQVLQDWQLKLPGNAPLPNRQTMVPFVYAASEAFQLQNNVMVRYPVGLVLDPLQRSFNYRVSTVLGMTENTLGLIGSVFRVVSRPVRLSCEKAELVVLACICLHNFLINSERSKDIYAPEGVLDSESGGIVIHGSWRKSNERTSLLPLQSITQIVSQSSHDIRQEYAEYFASNSNSMSWQSNIGYNF